MGLYIVYYRILVFLILKECSGILWATVILDGNLMHILFIHRCVYERHKSNIALLGLYIVYYGILLS
jgi:hypothetical protein